MYQLKSTNMLLLFL